MTTDTTLRARVARHLDAGDLDAAWAALEPHRAELERDRELARVWLELLAATPERRGLADEARAVLARWPDDPPIVIAACAALNALAERRPLDEPPLADGGPARIAAEAALRCIEKLDARAASDPAVAGYLWINRANALRMLGRSEDLAARAAFDRAVAIAPDRGGFWLDLALLHKWRGRFQEAFDATLKARARMGETRAVQFNLAICATALGQGDVAAGAWRKLGIPAEVNAKSGMPVVEGLPPVQVRVPAKGPGADLGTTIPDRAATFEILWVLPLSPVHGVVQTPTFRETPVDYGDVILWDAAPIAIGEHEGEKVPRFALLEILRRGDERRFRFVGLEQRAGDVDRLAEALPEGCVVVVHTERVEHVCPRCASGDALKKHEHLPPEEHRVTYGKIVVPASVDLGAFRDALEAATRKDGRVVLAVPALYEALGDTRRAGQEHQAWRGIERTAIRKGLA